MSRVDQALRRAAEEVARQTTGTDKPEAAVSAAGDVAELFQDSFPVESDGSRPRTAPVEPAAPTVPVPSTPPASRTPPADESDDGALLQHLDAHLAGKTVIDENTSPVSREQYRRLAAALHRHRELTGLKVIMITSAAVGEGKTLTASNLALTLSESYKKKVLLIDADLRRPAVQKIFRLDDGPGLGEGLMPGGSRKMPVHRISSLLSVVAAGRPTADPISRLTSDRMRRMLDEARDAFEWIIIDTPPVALLPDANLLSAMVDGAVLVIRANGPSYSLVQRAIEAIGREKIVGTVLNRATSGGGRDDDDYYQYYYSYSADSAKASTVAAP
jgi:capsular exopolysaccharide synthesis family protein